MKNVLLVTIDSLRAEMLGSPTDNTPMPYLSSLADNGINFENAISPGPRTPSSMAAIFTGESNRHSGYWMDEQREAMGRHMRTHKTIPERLHEKGYTTVGFTANPWTATDTSFDKGFDEFVELKPDSEADIETLPDMRSINFVDKFLKTTGKEDFLKWESRREWFSHWTSFYEEISAQLDSINEPYFAWVFLMDTHHPYIVPPTFREETNIFKMYYSLFRYKRERDDTLPKYVVRWLQESYRDAARSADGFLKQFYEEFRNPETTLIVHGDHGEAHGEHGTYGHEQKLYEENVHVPLVVHGGSNEEDVCKVVSLTSIPDIIDQISSKSVVDTSELTEDFAVADVESIQIADRRAESIQYEPHYISLRGEEIKYIDTAQREELYDLSKDPSEQKDLSTHHSELVAALSELAEIRVSKREEKRRILEAVKRAEF